ncbi:uncharacterized protein LOC115881796 isoform X1 [Sitophilus oryzae]|uniref:Uncharacterized protein LOC115881796 isoform X1 n=1 Tax=Sitophilus oryzae TaxID=7048 RepID=A0A6J2XUU3_SITOR|nr:uncharacterized protein LOC115881796 isoform X1 [Sitophilus oryzae]
MAFLTMEIEPTPSTSKYNEKIEKVLQKFLKPNFVVKNDVYLNLFLTHLIGKENNKKLIYNKQLNEQCSQWIIQAYHLWDKDKNKPSIPILSLVLNLASHLSTDEQVFVRLNSQNVYESIVAIAQENGNEAPAAIVGYITLVCSFLEHKSGLQWVLATNYWTEIVDLGLKAHTLYIRQKAYEFVIKLLQKTVKFNKSFCTNLIKLLIKPLTDALNSSLKNIENVNTEVVNKELFESLLPTLTFLSEVTESLLKNYDKDCLQIFLELNVLETLQNILPLSQIEDFSYMIVKNWLNVLVFKFCVKLEGVKQIRELQTPDNKLFFTIMISELEKVHTRFVLKICHHAQTLWSYSSTRLPMCVRGGENIEFQNQMLIIQLMPVLLLTCQFLGNEKASSVMLNDDYRRCYIHKWVTISAIRTIKICFKWKELLEKKKDLIDDATFSFQLILKSKKLLNREKAAMFFQPLVYCLRDSLTHCELHPEVKSCPRFIRFLDSLIDTLIDVVTTFDITWKDSIETISVLKLACEFLNYPLLCNKLVVKGLKLLDMAISRYMSPDMVLLMDNHRDSVVAQTGTLLYAKCHDGSWEIRDSALEVVYTLSSNAHSKYPAFKNILLDVELPQLVLKMALNDGEYYVRASAVKCLQELIQSSEIWELYLNMDHFCDDILDIFQKETEGIVRKEAAELMYKIVKFYEFPEETQHRLHDVMTYAATGDLHWEVKLYSLKFWFKMVEKLLMDEGMIDRKFPSVTFSKEHRKIVTLNDVEVKRRIIKVLNQLSDIGCLAVLKDAVEDECHIEVSQAATDFTRRLLDLFKKYKVTTENVDYPVKQRNEESNPSCSSVPPTPSSLSSGSLESPSQFSEPSPYPEVFNVPSTPCNASSELGIITPPNSVCGQNNRSKSNSDSLPPTEATDDLMGKEAEVFTDLTNVTPMIYEINADKSDSSNADKILEDLLNSNDMALLQGIYSPTDEPKTTSIQIKKKSYLPPSEYLNFIFNSPHCSKAEQTKTSQSVDEFDSLLDDILEEYGTSDVNSMDCY